MELIERFPNKKFMCKNMYKAMSKVKKTTNILQNLYISIPFSIYKKWWDGIQEN